jgi:hypothetical protein
MLSGSGRKGALRAALWILIAGLPASLPGQVFHRVQCGAGQTIATALKVARRGDAIHIRGTCRESFVVTTDHLTIEGDDGTTIQGQGGNPRFDFVQIDIQGAQGVVLRNLIVRDAPGFGIQVTSGAAAVLENVTVRRSGIGVMAYIGSSARLKNVSVLDNFVGVIAGLHSSIQLIGEVRANNNLGNAFDINGNSAVEIFEARFQANNNGNRGMTLDDFLAERRRSRVAHRHQHRGDR